MTTGLDSKKIFEIFDIYLLPWNIRNILDIYRLGGVKMLPNGGRHDDKGLADEVNDPILEILFSPFLICF